MAFNFKMRVRRSTRRVYLIMEGDFDGSAAQQLLYWMRCYRPQAAKVIVDTRHLQRIEAFGLNVFAHNLGSLQRHSNCFAFIGQRAHLFTNLWPTDPRPSHIREYREKYNEYIYA